MVFSRLLSIVSGLNGAVIVKIPSVDKVLVALSGSHCSGTKYFLTKCLEIRPSSSALSSCFPVKITFYKPLNIQQYRNNY